MVYKIKFYAILPKYEYLFFSFRIKIGSGAGAGFFFSYQTLKEKTEVKCDFYYVESGSGFFFRGVVSDLGFFRVSYPDPGNLHKPGSYSCEINLVWKKNKDSDIHL